MFLTSFMLHGNSYMLHLSSYFPCIGNAAVASLQHAAKPIRVQRSRQWPASNTRAMFVCLMKMGIKPTCCTSDCIQQVGRSMRLVKNACFDNALLSLQLHIHSSRCEADAGREEG